VGWEFNLCQQPLAFWEQNPGCSTAYAMQRELYTCFLPSISDKLCATCI